MKEKQMHLAAHLYYVDNLDQASVARFLQISQAKVSRLLVEARNHGIVHISVTPYESRNAGLEEKLAKTLGLKSVLVVRQAAVNTEKLGVEASALALRSNLAHFTKNAIARLFEPNCKLVVGGGVILRILINSLPAASQPTGITAIQGMGTISPDVADYDSSELCRALARKWGGNFMTLDSPAVLPDVNTRDVMAKLESIRRVKEMMKRADAVLVGIGSPDWTIYSLLARWGILKLSDLESLKAMGAVAEVFGRFIDANGNECDSPLRDRTLNMEIADLRNIPNAVAVVEGSRRSAAILAAVNGGLIKSLIVDEGGGQALLDLCQKTDRPLVRARRGKGVRSVAGTGREGS